LPLLPPTFFFQGDSSAQTDPTLGAKCQAWYQKALSGQWFTKKEGADFAATEPIQETLGSVPGCGAFFQLQRRCEDAYNAPDVAEMQGASAAVRRRAKSELVRTIETVSGCKSIIGFRGNPMSVGNGWGVCEIVREEAKRLYDGGIGELSPRLQSILRECADESIRGRTSSMLRPAV
jgi:hypothetical protein